MESVEYAGFAGLILAAYYLYTIFRVKLRVASKEELQKLGFSFGALVLLAFIVALNAAEFAAQVGGNPTWTDPQLTAKIGIKLMREAERALRRCLDAMRALAMLNAITTVVFWVAAVLSGGLTLLVAWLVNIGVEMLFALMRAVVMAAQAVWATGYFYYTVGTWAPTFRLLAPLGVALMTAPRLRRGGAGIFALGVLLGYAAPYALNAAAAAADFGKIRTPDPINATLLTPGLVDLYQRLGDAVEPVPPGALLLLSTGNGTMLRAAGVLTPLPASFTVERVALTNAYLPWSPASAEIPFKLAKLNCTAPANGTPRLEDCVWYDYPIVNLTLPPGLLVAGDRRGWGWAMNVTGRFAVDLKLADPYVDWYRKRFPGLDSKVVVRLEPGWGEVQRYNCSVPVEMRMVNTTCTKVRVVLRGSLGSHEVREGGWSVVVVNGTNRYLRPTLTVRREAAPPLEWSGWDAALTFNNSARLLNASMPIGSVQITFAEVNGTKLAERVTIINYTALQRGGPPTAVKTFTSPIRWPKPPNSTLVTVEAVYAGEVEVPAVVAFALEPYGVPADDSITLLFDDPIVRLLDSSPRLNELARNWLNLYPFLTLAALYFAAAVVACDILSGLLGGPSIFMRFVPSRWRGAYWGIAIGAVVTGILSALGGKGLRIPERGLFLGKYERFLGARGRQLRRLMEKAPLAKLESAVVERIRTRLVPRISSTASSLRAELALALAARAKEVSEKGLRRKAVYKALLRMVESRTPYALLAAAAKFSWELMSRSFSPYLGTAILGALAATLRSEAYKRHGSVAPLKARHLILAASTLDTVRILLTPRSLLNRLVVRAALGAAHWPMSIENALRRLAAHNVLNLAILAAGAAGDKELVEKLQRVRFELQQGTAKPENVVKHALEVWRQHEKAVEPFLREAKAKADEFVEKARKLAEGGGSVEEVRKLLTATHELSARIWQLPRTGAGTPPHIARLLDEVNKALDRSYEALVNALAALEAREKVLEQARTIARMPPVQPHEKPAAVPVAGWEKWLAAAGLPLDQAYKLGEKLNLMPGTLLDSAVALLKEPDLQREKVLAAIENAFKATEDPRLKGLLDALKGAAIDGEKLLEELKQGRVLYAIGYAAGDARALATALAPAIAKQLAVDEVTAFEGALLALRKALGEDVAVPAHAASAYAFLDEVLTGTYKPSPWTRFFEDAGIPKALAEILSHTLGSGDQRFAVLRALRFATEQGFGAEAAKAVEVAVERGTVKLDGMVRGALDAAKGVGLKTGEAVERLKARDEYAFGYASVAPDQLAKAVAPALAEILGVSREAAERGALSAVKSFMLWERAEPLDAEADLARKYVLLALAETAWKAKGLTHETAEALAKLESTRLELAKSLATQDLEGAVNAIARGLDAMLELRERRGELREKLPPEAYERIRAEWREWKQLHEAMVESLELYTAFFESLRDLILPSEPAHAQLLREAREAVKADSELEKLIGKEELRRIREITLYDAAQKTPDEAYRLLNHVENPYVKGALKARIGEPPEGPGERLGWLYANTDKLKELEVPRPAVEAVKEIVAAYYESGRLPQPEELKLDVLLQQAVEGDDEALGRYIVAVAVVGEEPLQALRSVMEVREARAEEEARRAVEGAVEAKRRERELESWYAAYKGSGEQFEGLISLLPEGSVTIVRSGDSIILRINEERLARLEKEGALTMCGEAEKLYALHHQLFVTAPTPEARAEVLRRMQILEELMEKLREVIEG